MKKKIIVVGGVAGGASFAARMRRLDEFAEIIMFEKGEHISFANCGLPYYVGNKIRKRESLILQTPGEFQQRFNIDVRIHSEVTAVHPDQNTITYIYQGDDCQETYDYLVLSPGCAPLRPPIPGISNDAIFTLRNLADVDRIKNHIEYFPAIDQVVIVGGGFIGLEMVENLRTLARELTLVELVDQVFMPVDKEMANLLHQHLISRGVTLQLNDGVKEFRQGQKNPVEVILNSGKNISASMVILAIGVKPDTAFLKDSGIVLNERGAIKVNPQMRTNFYNIFAVGDAIEVVDLITGQKIQVPLAGPANRQGRIVADTIAGIDSTYKHTQGTAICRIFDLTAAVTGLNEKNAKKLAIPYKKSYTHSPHHAGYYPGASMLSLKVLFDPVNGQLLGAQIIGKQGVDKRIDVLATAIRHRLSVSDLTELELAYAPPYGSAKDPVNMTGFVAQNIITQKMPVFYVEELNSFNPEHQILLDVRTPKEYQKGAIDHSLLIPIDDLRKRINELDKNKEILIYCQIGLRGYLATRILMQHGFKVRNLSGGYITYQLSQMTIH